MTQGQGFQFTPNGFTALGDASGATSQQVGAALPIPRQAQPEPEPEPVQSRAPIVSKPLPTSAPLRPVDVRKAVRARVKELKAEIRRLGGLKKELAALERMLAAASGKTLAPVRAIDTARRAG